MTENLGSAGVPDAVGVEDQQRAAAEQAEERQRLDEETRRLRGDPGDPRDRRTLDETDRLMEQQQQRDFHP